VKTIAGRPDLIETLVNGGTVSVLQCDTTDEDGCLNPSSGTVKVTGFNSMLLQAFEGTGGSVGIIAKIASSTVLTAGERQVLGLLPNGLGGLVIRLSSKSQDAAKSLVEDTAPQIAGLMARRLVRDMLQAVVASVASSQDTRARDVQKLIDSSWSGVRAEEQLHQAQWGSLAAVVANYESLMGVAMPPRRGFGSAVTAVGMSR
jgi:conjugative transfer pilus assembly protein TraH